MTKAAIYARVSYDDRGREARNLEGQIEDGRGHCADRAYRIVAELAEDDRGASGADWNLPKLNQALDMARAGEFDVFVTRELDRLARGLAKQLVIESEFKRYGVEVEYVLAQYDDTPEGQLNKNIRAVIAEFEREKIAQRMRRGRQRIAKAGKVMLHGNRPPYGYRVENKELVICEEEARVIRLIFSWYAKEGLSLQEIADRLEGVPTYTDTRETASFPKKKGRGQWSPTGIRDIIGNEVYQGTWYYGRGKGRVNPEETWIEVDVPAIVSKELWQRAQERKDYNKEMAGRRTKNPYLLRRRVVCGHCGAKMAGKAAGSGYLYYRCPNSSGQRVNGKDCDAPYYRADRVDSWIWKWLIETMLDRENLEKQLRKQQQQQEETAKPLRDRLAVMDDLLADHQSQLERLLDLYLAGDFEKEMLTERKTGLENTIGALEREQANLMLTLEGQTLSDDDLDDLIDYAWQMCQGLAAAHEDFEMKRRIVERFNVWVLLYTTEEDGQRMARAWCTIREEEDLVIEYDSP